MTIYITTLVNQAFGFTRATIYTTTLVNQIAWFSGCTNSRPCKSKRLIYECGFTNSRLLKTFLTLLPLFFTIDFCMFCSSLMFCLMSLLTYLFHLQMRAHQMWLYSRPYKCKIAAIVSLFCTNDKFNHYCNFHFIGVN